MEAALMCLCFFPIHGLKEVQITKSSVSEENYRRIKVAMKFEEVVKILGTPNANELEKKDFRIIGDTFLNDSLRNRISSRRFVGWYGNGFIVLIGLDSDSCVLVKSIHGIFLR